MTLQNQLVVALVLHGLLAATAIYWIRRVDTYTKSQSLIQAALALLVPVLGAIFVLVMAKEALAEPEKPDDSRFDRNYIGSGD